MSCGRGRSGSFYILSPLLLITKSKILIRILVLNEWTHSYGLGRPSAIHEEE